MKPIYYLLSACLLLLVSPKCIWGQIVAQLKMDEGSGTTLIDASQYGNNGTIIGSPSWVSGRIGQALQLNGSSQYASVSSNASLNLTTAITLAAWIKPEKVATQYIIKKATLDGTDGYELSLSTASQVFFRVNQKTSQNTNRVNSTTSYPTNGNTWIHVAATFDGSVIKLYINGVLNNSLTLGIPVTINSNTLAVGIGAQSDGGSKFQGAMDDARIYNTALSASEIANIVAEVPPAAPVLTAPANGATAVGVNPTLNWNTVTTATSYQAQVSAASDFASNIFNQSGITATSVQVNGLANNTVYYWRVSANNTGGNGDWSQVWSFTTASNNPLVAQWKMDEGSGTILIDASQYGNNGTIIGGPSWVSGRIGQALQLNGSSQYASVSSNASLNITTAITLAAWIKPEKVATQYIIKKATLDGIDGYELSLSNAGQVFFRVNQKTSQNTNRVISVTSYPTNGNTWMHVAATFDGSVIKLYINGVLNNSVTLSTPVTINSNTLAVGIGAQSDGASKFQGAIDDARTYNTTLSASEIANIVAEAPPTAPVLTAPANNATAVAVNPTLNWNSVATATSYQAQVSATSDFASTVFNQNGITATSVQVNGLANNTVYYWRVRASNTAGNGDWSTVWSFTTSNGGPAVTLTRGPYMNLATQNSIIIRWRTDVATDSKVSFGDAPGNLTASETDPIITKEHIVKVKGLADNTKYYYSIGTSDQKLQGDANNYFKTLPVSGSTQKVRILAMGDMGWGSTTEKNVRNAYLNYNGANYTDIWMLLGDNAYSNGLDSEFQTNFFNIYQDNLTKNHVLWPAPGNHDYANSPARQADHAITYYDIFSLPANGEAGGVPSGTEDYYSYDYGNIHFVSLDSYGWETNNTRLYDTTGPQAKWLKQDLAANNQKWTIVYFHHPPYSKGTDSDTDPQLINIRQKIVPILERYNVDLVLCGHSHIYERSFLINGHYGLENTFNITTMALSNSSGQYDGSSNSCLYVKNSSDVRNGIVYAVVGSAGTVGGTSTGYPHNAMEYSNNAKGGAMVIEIEDNRLDAKWVCSDGIIRDNFTIMKGVNKTINTTISSGESTTLTASWTGNYIWSNGETTRSITVSPQNNIAYTVGDNFGCLKDSFNITVATNISSSSSASSSISSNNLPWGSGQLKIKAFPNPSLNNFALIMESSSSENVEIVITDIYGRKVYQAKGAVSQTYTLGNGFSSGMYIVKVMQGKNIQTLKLIKRK